MTAPITRTPDHRWSKWRYNHGRRRWYRRCVIAQGNCTAVESVPRGHKPKERK